MTKNDIVKSIAEDLNITQQQTKEIIQKLFDGIVNLLVEEGRVELRNFGVFEVQRRAPRKARNPRAGEKVFVPAKSVVTFKAGRNVQQIVNESGKAPGAVPGVADTLRRLFLPRTAFLVLAVAIRIAVQFVRGAIRCLMEGFLGRLKHAISAVA